LKIVGAYLIPESRLVAAVVQVGKDLFLIEGQALEVRRDSQGIVEPAVNGG
jgi:hypothetical protein